MSNWPLLRRIWLIVAVALTIGGGFSALLLERLQTMAAAYQDVLARETRDELQARVMQVEFKKQVQEWKDILLRGSDPEALKKYSQAFQQQGVKVRNAAQQLALNSASPEARKLAAEFLNEHERLNATYGAALTAFTEAHGTTWRETDQAVKGKDRAPTDLVDKIAAELEKQAVQRVATQKASVTTQRRWIACLLGIGFLTVGAFTFFISRGIVRSLGRATSELDEGAGQIVSAASQIAASSQALAQGASEQASTLQETSSSTHEINASSRTNAQGSVKAAELMAATERQAIDNNRKLEELTRSISEINESGKGVSKIIKTIEEIAFQTNLLALNAAVEAARAGEAGAGFAVVADEVRSLAGRCSQAAKDTGRIIADAQHKSQAASGKLTEVLEGAAARRAAATQTKLLVDNVNTSSQQQARHLEQIASAISQIEEVTQTTAASAEENAAAAEELNAQSASLRDIVGRLSQFLAR